MRKPKIIKWTLEIDDLDNIVDTISLVDDPAIEINWLAFNKSKHINQPEDMDEFALLSMVAEEQRLKFKQTPVPKKDFSSSKDKTLLLHLQ